MPEPFPWLNSADAELAHALQSLLGSSFEDLVVRHHITVRVGRFARRRLGSVRRDTDGPLITLNPLLLHPQCPRSVLVATIAHELCHLVHGFAQEGTKPSHAPHRGGVVERELDARGLGRLNEQADKWLRDHWDALVEECARFRDGVSSRPSDALWQAYLAKPGFRTLSYVEAQAISLADLLRLPPPSAVRWLLATRRHTSPSYGDPCRHSIQLHGLLADPAVPDGVIVHNLAYWLAAFDGEPRESTIVKAFAVLGRANERDVIRSWQIRIWPAFREKNHPLRRKG